MKTIILVQHTEAEHHLNGRIGAWQDWNLTAHGREQAFRIGEWLKCTGCGSGWAMYVSPQARARQTADEISRTLGITPVVREELREVNAGEGNGKTREWYREHAAPRGPVFDSDHRDFPDAESDRELWNRLLPFYADLMAAPDERILVVSHGTTLSFLQSMLSGQSVEDRGRFRFNGRSGSLSRFTVEDSGRVTADYVNHFID
ncbi:MAG: phosphoglycerate mutase family protein [Clostridiales bacterium]|nr:phosphoglycerate mutase family protein [Clostridiales bacterium]